MTHGYKIENQKEAHFLTFQIVGWVDLFTRQIYRDIVIDSLKYCRTGKGLQIFGYVIMSNHVHLLVQSKYGNLSSIIRDFKSYTSKIFLKNVQHEQESRRSWMLKYFRDAAKKHRRNSIFQIWTHENHPENVFSNKFIAQKLNYIHDNPVRAGIVQNPEDYSYSSARNYADLDALMEIDLLEIRWNTF